MMSAHSFWPCRHHPLGVDKTLFIVIIFSLSLSQGPGSWQTLAKS